MLKRTDDNSYPCLTAASIAYYNKSEWPRTCGSFPGRDRNFSAQNPDRLWGPPRFLFNASFPRSKAAGAWSWTPNSIKYNHG